MIKYTVAYVMPSEGPGLQKFLCHADDAEHAMEQCRNAYPDGIIVAAADMKSGDGLLTAAEAVLANWERGDLAAAVRQLADAVAEVKSRTAPPG